MEDTVTHNTKVSDSGYSNSCSNSQSQRSGSSQSRHSGSSSGSSGYCGHPSTLGSSNDSFQHPSATKQRKEHKKKKLKAMTGDVLNDSGGTITNSVTVGDDLLEAIPAVAGGSPLPQNIENDFLSSTSMKNVAEKNDNVQLNPLSHPSLSISCIKKLKSKDVASSSEEVCEGVPSSPAAAIDNKNDNEVEVDHGHGHKTPSLKEEFSAVVSMQEGVILYTTTSLTDVLGYPQDMWLGRSLIDFVHPKDRKAFNSHVTSGIATPLAERHNQNGESSLNSTKNSFYCCLRQYRGLKSTGFGVVDKKVSYLPCQLTLAFREISSKSLPLALEYNNDSMQKKEGTKDQNVLRAILLVITARIVHSVYKKPDEICASSTFATRHSTALEFTHVDSEVVTYLGYMPQDVTGRSVFDFYHPEDLPYLKEVYENVFRDKGQPFRSKPYRFRTQNGGFAVIETEWSSFVNPWTKKVEFVTGQHRVIKGPPNPDVTMPVAEPEMLQIPDEVIKESKAIQEKISNMLSETAETPDFTKNQMTKYCKELLKFIENFVDAGKFPSAKPDGKPVPPSFTASKVIPNEKGTAESQRVSSQNGPTDGWIGPSASEHCKDRDSVVLGEISPHHEYYDSKSSTETPPSYTQLNYNDNIQRFFESKPKTTLSDESSGSKMSLCRERNTQHSSGGDEEGKTSPAVDSSCGGSHNRNSGLNNESGGSSDLSSGSASGNNNNSGPSINKYRTPHLTEALLSKHNENMEKKMVQMHRERSKTDREQHKLKDGRHKKNYDKLLDEQNSQGVKRTGSHSWEGEPYKSIKQTHGAPQLTNGNTSGSKPPDLPASTAVYPKQTINSSSSGSVWPPFTVTVTPLHSTPPCATHLSYPATPVTSTVVPVYYLPSEVPSPARITNNNCSTEAVRPPLIPPYIQQPQPQPPFVPGHFQYLTSMMYQPMAAMPMLSLPQVMYSPLTMLPAPLLPTQPMKPAQPQPSWPPQQQHKEQSPQSNCNNVTSQSQPKKCSVGKKTQRPASQATSVKAEPGSALCSIASNSMQQALSETSKREGKSIGTPSPQSLVSQESSDGSDPEKPKAELDDVNSNDLLETNINDSSSYYSSFYSFMKTDEKSDESMKSLTENDSSVDTPANNKREGPWRRKFHENSKDPPRQMRRQIRKVPPWMENISLSPDLVFRYQVSEKELSQVLEADLKLLADIHQPLMVNDQLCQLYLDIENFHQQECSLETSIGVTSSSGTSSGEGDDSSSSAVKAKKKYRTMEYHDRMVMLFEENAPLPPPLSHPNPSLLSVPST